MDKSTTYMSEFEMTGILNSFKLIYKDYTDI